MNKQFFGAAMPLAALTACSSGEAPETMQPGQWDVTLTVTEASAPGISEEMQADLVAELNRELAMEPVCVTEEDAANPSYRLFVPAETEGECDFDGSSVENGAIAIAGQCGEGGELTIEGSYGATSLEAELRARVEDGSEILEFSADLAGERTGDCEA